MLGHGWLHVLTLLRAPKNGKHLSICLFVWLSICLTVVFWHIKTVKQQQTSTSFTLTHICTFLEQNQTVSDFPPIMQCYCGVCVCVCVVVHLWRWWQTLLLSHLLASSSVSLIRVSHTHTFFFVSWGLSIDILLMLYKLYILSPNTNPSPKPRLMNMWWVSLWLVVW